MSIFMMLIVCFGQVYYLKRPKFSNTISNFTLIFPQSVVDASTRIQAYYKEFAGANVILHINHVDTNILSFVPTDDCRYKMQVQN